MTTLAELNQNCQVPGVKFVSGPGNFICVDIANESATARISTYGAHILSFIPAGERELLFMSRKSRFKEAEPIRGGVPVCWPWFGPAPVDGRPAHGFLRLAQWEVEAVLELSGGAVQVVLSLDSEEADLPMADFPFHAEMIFTVGSTLEITLAVRNCGDEAVETSGALHTYFSVGAVEKISIHGLDGVIYTDKVPNAPQVLGNVQRGDIRFNGEVDWVYSDTADAVEIVDPEFGRTIRVEKSGSLSTVVWNPWIDKAKAMADFGDDEYHQMVCVEAANALEDSRLLLPGVTQVLTQKISIR